MTRTTHARDELLDTIESLTLVSPGRAPADDARRAEAAFARIVLGHDGSDASRAALDWARLLARRDGAQLHLVTCIAPPPYAADGRILDNAAPAADALGTYQALVRDEQAGATRLAEDTAARLQQEGIKVTTEVTVGVPGQRMKVAAREQEADLLVLGSHEHGILGHLAAPDNADTARHDAERPVLIANGPPDVSRIVVPVDGSPGSHRAAITGRALAERLDLDLLLLHVFPRPMFADLARARDLYDEARARRRDDRPDASPDDTSVPAKVRFGTSVDEIVAEARDPASLIVMGTRGLTGMKARLLGSVSHAVVHAAPHAVLLVPEPET